MRPDSTASAWADCAERGFGDRLYLDPPDNAMVFERMHELTVARQARSIVV